MLEINGTTLLNLDEVCQLVKLHRRTIERHIKKGRFLPPRRHGRERVWVKSEVEAWLDRQFSTDTERDSSRERA
jgi:excisionase family DNA binding protein